MPAIPHMKERFERGVVTIIEKDTLYGKLGKLVSGVYVFAVPTRPGYVYCRIEQGTSEEPAECLAEVGLDPYTRCKFKREGGVLVAKEYLPPDAARNYGADGRLLNVPGLPMPDRGSTVGGPVFDTLMMSDDGFPLVDADGYYMLRS